MEEEEETDDYDCLTVLVVAGNAYHNGFVDIGEFVIDEALENWEVKEVNSLVVDLNVD